MPNNAVELLKTTYAEELAQQKIQLQDIEKQGANAELMHKIGLQADPFFEMLQLQSSRLTAEEKAWLMLIRIEITNPKGFYEYMNSKGETQSKTEISLTLPQVWLLIERQIYYHSPGSWEHIVALSKSLASIEASQIKIILPDAPVNYWSLIMRHRLRISGVTSFPLFTTYLMNAWSDVKIPEHKLYIDTDPLRENFVSETVMQLWNRSVPFFVHMLNEDIDIGVALYKFLYYSDNENTRTSCIVKDVPSKINVSKNSSGFIIAPAVQAKALYKANAGRTPYYSIPKFVQKIEEDYARVITHELPDLCTKQIAVRFQEDRQNERNLGFLTIAKRNSALENFVRFHIVNSGSEKLIKSICEQVIKDYGDKLFSGEKVKANMGRTMRERRNVYGEVLASNKVELNIRSYRQNISASETYITDKTTAEDAALQMQLANNFGDIVGVYYHPDTKAKAQTLWQRLTLIHGRPAAIFTYDHTKGLIPVSSQELGFECPVISLTGQELKDALQYNGHFAWQMIEPLLGQVATLCDFYLSDALDTALRTHPRAFKLLLNEYARRFANAQHGNFVYTIRGLLVTAVRNRSKCFEALLEVMTDWTPREIAHSLTGKLLVTAIQSYPKALPIILQKLRKTDLDLIITGLHLKEHPIYYVNLTMSPIEYVLSSHLEHYQSEALAHIIEFIAFCYSDYPKKETYFKVLTDSIQLNDKAIDLFLETLFENDLPAFMRFVISQLVHEQQQSKVIATGSVLHFLPNFLLKNNRAALNELIEKQPEQLLVILRFLILMHSATAEMGVDAVFRCNVAIESLMPPLSEIAPAMFYSRLGVLAQSQQDQAQLLLLTVLNPEKTEKMIFTKKTLERMLAFVSANRSKGNTAFSRIFYQVEPEENLEKNLQALCKKISENGALQAQHLGILKTVLQMLLLEQKNGMQHTVPMQILVAILQDGFKGEDLKPSETLTWVSIENSLSENNSAAVEKGWFSGFSFTR